MKIEVPFPQPRFISEILREQPNAVAIYGISANPPQRAHRETVIQLRCLGFEKVIVYLSGIRDDKPELEEIDPKHRIAMAKFTFGDIDGVEIVTEDIDAAQYSTSYELDQRFKERGLSPWHVFGWDILQGGKDSQICQEWHQGKEFWEAAKILPFKRARYDFSPSELPPTSAAPVDFQYDVCSTDVRESIMAGNPFHDLVTPEVAQYIQEHNLYGSQITTDEVRVRLNQAVEDILNKAAPPRPRVCPKDAESLQNGEE